MPREKSTPLYFDQLKALYKSSKTGYLSPSKFVLKAKAKYPELTKKQISDWVTQQQTPQITKRTPFKGYFKTIAPPHSFQIDIFFMDNYKHYNKFGAFLMFIDIISRKMFIEPLKSRTLETVLTGIKKIVAKIGTVNSVFSDNEFDKKGIKDYFKSKDIRFSSIVSKEEHISKGNRLGIVDTATRTIKRLIKRYMLEENTPKFIDVLHDLVENYNETPHSGINNKTPDDVYANEEYQKTYYRKAMEHNAKLQNKIDLEIGDYVRKAVGKTKFEKEKQTFSKELYVIFDIDGYKYKIMDTSGHLLGGRFKYVELQKIDPEKFDVPSFTTILGRHFGKSPSKPVNVDNIVENTAQEARKTKKVLNKLKAEGIKADKVIIKKTRTGTERKTTTRKDYEYY